MHPRSLSTAACLVALLFAAALLMPPRAGAAGFIFAGEGNGVNIITHPKGYTGFGSNLVITVGIDPTSLHAAQMVTPVQNLVRTMNALEVTTGNLQPANVPFSQWDFESVALHELGHAMGLSHCNLASESGLSGSDRDYTKASDGDGDNNANEPGEFDLDPGADGIRGSPDDLRGNDLNLNWFRKNVNDPGAPLPATVDSTTYGRVPANVPAGHLYPANGGQLVMSAMGYPNTESVMMQGSPNGEAQRTMCADDVGAHGALRMARSGLDRLQGTADDYTFTLVYAGLTANADIVLDFDDSKTGFATTYTSGQFINANHVRLTSPINMYFNNSVVPWFFNDVPNDAQPDPGDPDNVFVDFDAPENGTGAETFPFDNLADAIAFANENATINLEPGASGEIFVGVSTINKPLTLRNNNGAGGMVTVGN